MVNFFLTHHSAENIRTDIELGKTRVLFDGDELVGTGSAEENHITRVYVSPKHQGKGYGKFIMHRLESELFSDYEEIVLDASLPANKFYESISYQTVRHEHEAVDNGTIMVYDSMSKKGKE